MDDNDQMRLLRQQRSYLDLTSLQRLQTNDPTMTALWFDCQNDEDTIEEEELEQQRRVNPKIDLTDKDDNFLMTVSMSLRNNTFIREIYVADQRLSINRWTAIFDGIQNNKNINVIEIMEGSNFDSACAKLLATAVLFNKSNPVCCSLGVLFVDDTEIGLIGIFEIVNALCANPKGCTLTRLSLTNAIHENEDNSIEMVQQVAIQFVSLILQKTSKLKRLYLSSMYLGDNFLTIFADGIKYNTQLEKFYFRGPAESTMQGNVLTAVGAAALATALDYNKTLVELDLTNNAIGDNGSIALADTLQNNRNHLEVLILGNNGIASIGAQALATALHHNVFLVHLDISSNNLEDIGTTAIASALRYNTKLKKLNLRRCQITSSGAKELANALYYNTTLVQFDLSDNSITDEGAIALGNSLRYQPSIEQFYLKGNPLLSDDAWDFLKYNETVRRTYVNFHNTATLQSILDYNDTLLSVHSESDNMQHLLQQNYTGMRVALKKGLRRKQDIYSWLLKISGL
jgi:Ran GTPase-activating protein (RanGAP) involved in mRNA processing and transport